MVYSIQAQQRLAFIDGQGQHLPTGQSHTISPLAEFYLQETTTIPDSAKTVEVRLFNTKHELIGVLERRTVSDLLTAVETTPHTIVSEYRLAQNYPNPFNPSTIIGYQLPAMSHVVLKIYDVLGREVATLVNETKEAGSYEVTFNASKLTSGIYFSRLESNGKQFTKKMILLK